MNFAIIVVLLCQFSATVLEQTMTALNDNAERNSKKMSPKEKLRYERKSVFFGFFSKFLKYGSAVYLILAVILQVIVTFRH